jgi:hypothetical protein
MGSRRVCVSAAGTQPFGRSSRDSRPISWTFWPTSSEYGYSGELVICAEYREPSYESICRAGKWSIRLRLIAPPLLRDLAQAMYSCYSRQSG